MWNVFVIDPDGNCKQVNSEPYAMEDVCEFIREVCDLLALSSVLILPLGEMLPHR